MPIYDYVCPNCRCRTEITKPMSKAHSPEVCKDCQCEMRKKLSAPAFHLKGSGWYVTDYKSKTDDK